MFCFGFDSSYHAQLSNENLHYINLDSILLTVQMSLPINYLPYLIEWCKNSDISSFLQFFYNTNFTNKFDKFWKGIGKSFR